MTLPKISLLLLAVLSFSACSPTAPGDTPGREPTAEIGSTPSVEATATAGMTTPEMEFELKDTEWQLISFGPVGEESPVIEGTTITLTFEDNGQAGGSGGCNQYGGNYQEHNGTLSFSEMTSTLMACADEGVTEQEAQYYKALETASTFEIKHNELKIFYNDGQGVLTFVKASATPTGEPATAGTTKSDQPISSPLLPQSNAVQVRQIQMLDSSNGWAIGRIGASEIDRVLFTTDSGKTWLDQTPSRSVLQESYGAATATGFFASTERGWVIYHAVAQSANGVEARVLYTLDGGHSWTVSKPLQLADLNMERFVPSDLKFIDEQFGWLLAHLGAGMSHDYIAIFTTHDAGQTWERVTDPESNPRIQGCVKSGLVFTSEHEGWLSGNCPGLMPDLFLYHTADGGRTWSPVAIPAPSGQDEIGGNLGNQCGIPQIAALPENSFRIALRCVDFEQNTAQSWLYSTPDGGQTWQSYSLPVSNATFAFHNSQEGWLLNPNDAESQTASSQSLFHTSDGGRTWNSRAQVDVRGEFTIDFLDAHHGWIIANVDGASTLLQSVDGGASWETVTPVLTPS